MLLKLIGGILVIAACSMFGIAVSNRYSGRSRELKRLRTSLQLLETEIAYGSNPLPYAFSNIGAKLDGILSRFYSTASENLSNGLYRSVSDAWNDAIEKDIKNSPFNKMDIELLRSFGNILGNSDSLDQQKHFKLFYAQLKHHEELAEEERRKNEKMYKSLGFLFGLVIFILLI